MSGNINSCHDCGASNATLRCSKVGVFGLASSAERRFAENASYFTALQFRFPSRSHMRRLPLTQLNELVQERVLLFQGLSAQELEGAQKDVPSTPD